MMSKEENDLSMIRENPFYIKYVSSPSDKVIKEAIKTDYRAVGLLKGKIDYRIQALAIKTDPRSASLMDEIDYEIQELLINKDPSNVLLIKNPFQKILLDALIKSPKLLSYLNIKDYDVLDKVFEYYPYAIRFMDEQDERSVFLAVKKNRQAARYVRKPSTKLIEYLREAMIYD